MTTVLVTGATGNVGRSVVADLGERGMPVRALVRDPDKGAQLLGDGVELVVGDLSDGLSVRRAVEGVDRVLLSSGDGPEKVAQEVAVIDAAAAAGVTRIVKVSTVQAQAGSPLPAFDWHGRIEQHLRASGLPAVILRASFYMTNLLMAADQVRGAGTLFAPAGGGEIAMIDPRDVGAVAAVALTADGHDGQTYVLTGPEAIGYERIAAELSSATGGSVDYVDVPEEAARQGLEGAGMPEWLVEHLVQLFALIRADALNVVTDAVRGLTGRQPRAFAEFARDVAPAFGYSDATASSSRSTSSASL
jgi:uncharacterized protein YbjT (DUF2867 family)